MSVFYDASVSDFAKRPLFTALRDLPPPEGFVLTATKYAPAARACGIIAITCAMGTLNGNQATQWSFLPREFSCGTLAENGSSQVLPLGSCIFLRHFYGAEGKRGMSTVDSRLLFRIIAADRQNLTAYSGVLYAGGH